MAYTTKKQVELLGVYDKEQRLLYKLESEIEALRLKKETLEKKLLYDKEMNTKKGLVYYFFLIIYIYSLFTSYLK